MNSPNNRQLRVASFEPRSLVNGPGVRAVLWVQGCGRRCPGCFNPDFLPRAGGRDVPVQEAIQWIQSAAAVHHPTIHSSTHPQLPSARLEGVTFSGGEPFDQAAALAEVARAVRAMGLGVLIFTGHPWEDLERSADSGHRALLEAADLLVAGPYQRDNPPIQQSTHPAIHCPPPHPLLSSANQELVFLTERYRNTDFGRRRRAEYRIGADGTVRSSGFPYPVARIPEPNQ